MEGGRQAARFRNRQVSVEWREKAGSAHTSVSSLNMKGLLHPNWDYPPPLGSPFDEQ